MRRLNEQRTLNVGKLNRLLRVGLAMFFVVLFLEIWVVNRLCTYGDKIAQLKSMQDSLEMENQLLTNQIAALSTLERVEISAVSWGFSSINSLDYYQPQTLALVH